MSNISRMAVSSSEERGSIERDILNGIHEKKIHNSLKGVRSFDAAVLNVTTYNDPESVAVVGETVGVFIVCRVRPLRIHKKMIPEPCDPLFKGKESLINLLISEHPAARSTKSVALGRAISINPGDIITCYPAETGPGHKHKERWRFDFSKKRSPQGRFDFSCLRGLGGAGFDSGLLLGGVSGGSSGQTLNFSWEASPVASKNIAMQEWNLWNKPVTLSDDMSEAKPLLKKYWDFHYEGKSNAAEQAKPKYESTNWKQVTHWSGVFISYCMKKADPKFPASAGHTGYFGRGAKNRLKIMKNPKKYIGKTMYVTFKPEEIYSNNRTGPGLLDEGDLIMNWRSPSAHLNKEDKKTGEIKPGEVDLRNITFDQWVELEDKTGASHSEIYLGDGTQVGGNTGVGIGATRLPKGKLPSGKYRGTTGIKKVRYARSFAILKRVKIVSSN